MPDQGATISGRCVDDEGQPLAGLEVRAFHRLPGQTDLSLGVSTTDSDGSYWIGLDPQQAEGLRQPQGFVFIQARRADEVIAESELVPAGSDAPVIDVRLRERPRGVAAPAPRRVHGLVRDEHDRLVSEATVRVFDRGVRSETLLGSAPTVDGQYEIRYLQHRNERGIDETNVLIEVVDESGRRLHRTPVQFGVSDDLNCDVSLRPDGYRGPSQWELRMSRLCGLLGDIPPEEVRESDEFGEITFLAGQTGWGPPGVAALIACYLLSAKTTQLAERVPPELFYAFLATGQPSLFKATMLEDFRRDERLDVLEERLLQDVVDLGNAEQRRLIDEAVAANMISSPTESEIETALRSFEFLRRKLLADRTFGSRGETVADLLSLVPAAAPHKEDLLANISAHAGPMDRLWDNLLERSVVPPETVRDLRRTVELAAMTRNHLPMVGALTARLNRGEASSMRDFAKLSRQDWIDLITGCEGPEPPIGTPEGIDGNGETERAEAYAARLDWYFERKYPTASFAAKLDRALDDGNDVPHASRSVARFLADKSDFHLDRHRIDHYLADHPDDLQEVDTEPGLRSDLMAVQRVFRLQPTFDAAEALLRRGLDSAQRIYELGEQRFLDQVADTPINAVDARKIYRHAETSYATVLALLGEYNTNLNGLAPAVVPGLLISDEQRRRIDDLPNLQTLFGSEDYCECAHCQSIYSPAAHFVDMLRFLDLRATGVEANKTCKQVLFERRPDLGDVELSCHNTDTPLPYIDLVNEVLEDAVAPSGSSISIDASVVAAGKISSTLQAALKETRFTVESDAEVEKSPIVGQWIVRDSRSALTLSDSGGGTGSGVAPNEFLVTDRRQTLGTAEELRAAPEHLNANAYIQLFDDVFPFELPFNFWDRQARSYLTRLGISQARLLQLFGENENEGTQEFLGLRKARAQLGILDRTLFRPAERDDLGSVDPPWKYWGLDEDNNAIPHPDFPADETKNLMGTWVEVLASVSVFLHRAGLTYTELRQLLDMVFVNPDHGISIADNPSCDTSTSRLDGLTAAALNRANGFIRLSRALGCTMIELDRFLGRVSPTLDHVLPAQLKLIAECMEVHERTGLDLEILSALFNGLSGVRYVDRAHGDAPILSVYEKTFRGDPASAAVFPPSPADFEAKVTDCAAPLMAALRITESDLARSLHPLGVHLPADSDAILRAQHLRYLTAVTTFSKLAGLSVPDMSQLLDLTDNSLLTSPHGTLTLLDTIDQLKILSLTIGELYWLLRTDGTVPPSPDPDPAQFISDLKDRHAKIVDPQPVRIADDGLPDASEIRDLLQQRADTQKQLLTTEAVASAIGVAPPIAALLLDARVNSQPLRKLFDGVLSADSALGPATSEQITAVDTALRRLRKSAFVTTRLGLDANDVAWWLAKGDAKHMSWPPLLNFPVAPGDRDLVIRDWLSLQSFYATWRTTPGTTVTAPQFAAALTAETPPETLAAMAGWSFDDFATIAKSLGWTEDDGSLAPSTVRLKLRSMLKRVSDCMAALRRIGATAERAVSWAAATGTTSNGADKETADDIKRVARARYDATQWRQIAQPIEDNLRETKRRDLVSWLVSHPDSGSGRNWHDPDGLYHHFLIDIEMSPCMLTSRLVQASAAVQLFVQRCMLGLEPQVHVDPEKDPRWLQWQWMKNYRVWEANRKVFLYPENWIEPELRDEKSQPFVELEQELLQNDVTADTVEQAYTNYLAKLDAVANLEIRTSVREHIDTTSSVLHVIGRARSSGGGDHYYRRNINGGRWTPWERIDLDIGSDHLIAAMENHRLFLMWPQFVEKSEVTSAVTAPQPGTSAPAQQPHKKWEVRLFRSERIKERWSPKELGDDLLIVEGGSIGLDVNNIGLHVTVRDGVTIELANTTKPDSFASVSQLFFHKVGRQLKASSFAGLWDWFPPPSSKFVNNAIRHDRQMQFGFAKRSHPTGWASPQVTDGMKNILVLRSLPYDVAYTVLQSDAADPGERGAFFYVDWLRTYFVRYWANTLTSSTASTASGRPLVTGVEWGFSFVPHYHPFVAVFAEQLNRRGLRGLLNRQIQLDPAAASGYTPFDFASYEPAQREDIDDAMDGNSLQSFVSDDYPVEEVDFSYGGAYSPYNWELFFHVPFLIASKLSANQKFEDALNWFHFIFDPIAGDTVPLDPDGATPTPQQKYWVTKPFYVRSTAEYQADRIAAILAGVAAQSPTLVKQVEEWRNNPFKPHLIAQMRTVAYQKNVVMKYIQTLIAWGDSLFAQDTMESINEATQLYVLAAAILGRRPRQVPTTKPGPRRTYNELKAQGLELADPLADVENLLPPVVSGGGTSPTTPALPQLNMLYFGLANNEKLLSLWDLVEDRLFKIRNCMNLAGMVRQLPLFAPPVDPGLLVKATAAGLSIAEALAETGAPLPRQRFTLVLAQARAAVDEVKALGSALGSALDKRDAEALAVIRQNLEHDARRYVLQIRADQTTEALRSAESLSEQRNTTQARLDHYRTLIDSGWNLREKDALALTEKAMSLEAAGTVVSAIAGAMAVIPDFDAGATGAFGSPTAKIKFGGSHLSAALQMTAGVLRGLTSLAQMGAGRASTIGGYVRREEDWNLQKTLAEKELLQIDKQILAAQIRHQVALKEHESQKIQIANNEAETGYLQSKFTNSQLYDWMVAQTSLVYFQTYQMALDLAKRAERSFRFEMGLIDSSYIQGPHWDSLRKGLLAGERLSYDLRRLETAYHNENQREYELIKHISLAQLDPVALLALKRSGRCTFTVPELAFDLDHPGHYFRRIKSVSLSIPCVVGPYTTIGARLTQTRGEIRISPLLREPEGDRNRYARTADDDRFQDQMGVVNSIATSQGQQDDGLFQLDFNDSRYLPFEGAGAISDWDLKLNNEPAQFAFATITDVVVHMNYTARDGKDQLAGEASKYAKRVLAGNPEPADTSAKKLFRVFDLRREYADQWQRFREAVPAAGEVPSLALKDVALRLPHFTRDKTKVVHQVEIAALVNGETKVTARVSGLGDDVQIPLTGESRFEGLVSGAKEVAKMPLGELVLQLLPDAKRFEELFLIIVYTVG
ncbi:neuraminidase-like domain-containing protein [Micromonospora sp. NPDC023814]|uniref:Tc toxin subunit A-related protein n=1 Tax=Micromonospora sp. NPDC023814 TaxID=3154596 RepID=UPI00340D6B3F